MDRKTLGWNAAAASFAYGFARLAERGWKYVGNDQLIGGTYPDNEAGVAALDWKTGEPNAKYWVVRMLATQLGAGRKTLHSSVVSSTGTNDTDALHVLPMDVAERGRYVLMVSKVETPLTVILGGAASSLATVLAGTGPEPGFAPPEAVRLGADGALTLGAYGVALVQWRDGDALSRRGAKRV